MREYRLIVLGTLLFVGCSLLGYIFPAYLAFVGKRLALDPTRFGILASADYLAIAVASLLSPWWVSRFAMKRWFITAALLICIAGNVLASFTTDFATLLALRLTIGLFGAGVLGVTSFVILSATTNVDRSFAIALTTAVASGALVIANAANLSALLPKVGPLAAVIAIAVIALPFTKWLSLAEHRLAPAAATTAKTGGTSKAVITALIAQCLWCAGPGAFWAFAQRIATDRGIPTGSVEIALSIGLLGGLLGAMAPVLQGARWGQIKPVTLATVALVLMGTVYQFAGGTAILAASMCAFYALWNYAVVYQISFISSLDHTGRFVAIMPATQVLGYSLGPFVTGLTVKESGNLAVLVSLAAFTAAGIGFYMIAFLKRHAVGIAAAPTISQAGAS